MDRSTIASRVLRHSQVEDADFFGVGQVAIPGHQGRSVLVRHECIHGRVQERERPNTGGYPVIRTRAGRFGRQSSRIGFARRVVRLLRSPWLRLPYDRRNPVVYDKDAVDNCYTDDYLMALASAGDVDLRGMITTSSVAPFNPHVPPDEYEAFHRERLAGVQVAMHSGFRLLPVPVRGIKGHLRQPASGRIEDTEHPGSTGGLLITEQARRASENRPLVIIATSGLSTVADAYLCDPTIVNRVIVAWLGGSDRHMGDYNGWVDPWSAHIVLQRMRLVQFAARPMGRVGLPQVRKADLRRLPSTPLREWMVGKDREGTDQPADRDGDAPPALALMRRDYVSAVRRSSPADWVEVNGRPVPALRPDPQGRVLSVLGARRDVATEEWWRAIRNPAAYHGSSAGARDHRGRASTWSQHGWPGRDGRARGTIMTDSHRLTPFPVETTARGYLTEFGPLAGEPRPGRSGARSAVAK